MLELEVIGTFVPFPHNQKNSESAKTFVSKSSYTHFKLYGDYITSFITYSFMVQFHHQSFGSEAEAECCQISG